MLKSVVARSAIAAIALCSVIRPAVAQTLCERDLPAALDAVQRNHAPQARWGILVETLSSQRPLYQREADRYFIPASNAKLLTTAAALQRLGPDYRVRTSVYRTDNGLHVIGRGDPSLTQVQLTQLAQQVAAAGETQIPQLLLDDSYFAGEAVNAHWQWEDVGAGYGAPVNSAILDRNEIPFILHPQGVGQPLRVEWERERDRNRWRVENRSQSVAEGEPEWLRVQRSFQDNTIAVSGQLLVGSRPEPVSVAEVYPNQAFLQVFRQELQAAGVRVGNTNITTEPARLKGVEIAGVASPTVAELVQRTNRVSDNLYAEVLLRWLGTTQANDGTSAAQRGLVAMEQTLMQLGVDAAAIRPNDGSGLSRLNWVTPRGLVQTLQGMARTPHAQIFRDSLPVAGESGTLSYRLGENGAVVRAKTGTLSGVSALSGYLEHPTYGTLTFAILVNQSDRPTTEQRDAIDTMVRFLAQVRPCSG